jgi:hypothetical protein
MLYGHLYKFANFKLIRQVDEFLHVRTEQRVLTAPKLNFCGLALKWYIWTSKN